jgi:hypothetical protein
VAEFIEKIAGYPIESISPTIHAPTPIGVGGERFW